MPVFEVTSPDGRTFEVTAPEGATKEQVLSYAKSKFAQSKPVEVSEPTKPKTMSSTFGDLLAGALRGAGSIGATALAPIDIASDALAGRGLSLQSNRDRRADMDKALASMGADTESTAYGLGKLGAEIAGTAGVGNVLARPVQALAASRAGVGIEPILEGAAKALQTGGFRVGPLVGTGAAVPARVIGGAATGGAAAGMVNPTDAGMGAAIGGAMPVAALAAGRTGEAVGSALRTGSRPSAERLDTARKAMDAGYLIPPSQIDPSFKNRFIESLSGKYETAQMASTQNQKTTDSLVRKALGIPQNAEIDQKALQAFRNAQYQNGYEPVKQFGAIQVGKNFDDALDNIVKNYTGKGTIPALAKEKQAITELVDSHRTTGFDSSDAIDAIRILRESADEAFAKRENAMGKTYKALAKAYEDAIDDGLSAAGRPDALGAYRDARQKIAQSYTVEKGLREGSGNVDARALGRELQKKKPLSDELRLIAQFGNTFDKAAQPPHLIGSPAVSALKPMMSVLAGATGAGAVGLPGLAAGAVNWVLPPVTRSVMFSKPYQRGLLEQVAPVMSESAPVDLLTQAGYRGLPILIGQ